MYPIRNFDFVAARSGYDWWQTRWNQERWLQIVLVQFRIQTLDGFEAVLTPILKISRAVVRRRISDHDFTLVQSFDALPPDYVPIGRQRHPPEPQ